MEKKATSHNERFCNAMTEAYAAYLDAVSEAERARSEAEELREKMRRQAADIDRMRKSSEKRNEELARLKNGNERLLKRCPMTGAVTNGPCATVNDLASARVKVQDLEAEVAKLREALRYCSDDNADGRDCPMYDDDCECNCRFCDELNDNGVERRPPSMESLRRRMGMDELAVDDGR